MRPRFFVKTGSGQSLINPPVTYEVKHYSFKAIGGPLRCDIEATGDLQSLWQLSMKLRERVEIMNDLGTVVWWGYVHEVQIGGDGITMDGMANRVAVKYQNVPSGNPFATTYTQLTPFVEDADSVTEFGEKEIIVTVGEILPDGAISLSESELDSRKYPIPLKPNLEPSKKVKAKIYCLGWWSTLSWKYYQDLSGLEFFDSQNNDATPVGDALGNANRYQTFRTDAGLDIDLSKVRLFASKVGTPPSDLFVRVRADNAGAVGAILSQGTLPQSSFSADQYQWVTIDMPFVNLAGATSFWLEFGVFTPPDANNYYLIGREGPVGGYRKGQSVTAGGAPEGQDVLFYVIGEKETSEVIFDIISSAGQFATTVRVETPSGVFQPYTRSGEYSAEQVLTGIEDLMGMGVAGGRRYLSYVDRNRNFSVFEEPEKGVNDFVMKKYNNFFDSQDNPIPFSEVPMRVVGNWAKRGDLLRLVGAFSRFIDTASIFVERIDYSPVNDSISVYPRVSKQTWDAI